MLKAISCSRAEPRPEIISCAGSSGAGPPQFPPSSLPPSPGSALLPVPELKPWGRGRVAPSLGGGSLQAKKPGAGPGQSEVRVGELD